MPKIILRVVGFIGVVLIGLIVFVLIKKHMPFDENRKAEIAYRLRYLECLLKETLQPFS